MGLNPFFSCLFPEVWLFRFSWSMGSPFWVFWLQNSMSHCWMLEHGTTNTSRIFPICLPRYGFSYYCCFCCLFWIFGMSFTPQISDGDSGNTDNGKIKMKKSSEVKWTVNPLTFLVWSNSTFIVVLECDSWKRWKVLLGYVPSQICSSRQRSSSVQTSVLCISAAK